MFVRRFIYGTRGAAAAEMALILPLSILLLFTSLEAGHYFYQQHQVVKALRDGARFAARQSFDDINCRGGSPSPIPAGIESNIQSLTRTGQVGGTTPRVANWDNNNLVTVTVTCPPPLSGQTDHTGIYDSAEPAPQVNVSTRLNYDSLFNGLGVITDSAVLGATQQATVMGI